MPPVPGYKVDKGELFGDRGDGLAYGWSADATTLARKRGLNPDPRGSKRDVLHSGPFPRFVVKKLFSPPFIRRKSASICG